jgi:hypothetical protein
VAVEDVFAVQKVQEYEKKRAIGVFIFILWILFFGFSEERKRDLAFIDTGSHSKSLSPVKRHRKHSQSPKSPKVVL